MTDERTIPVMRISLTNATIVSVMYLVVATGVELVRRAWNPRWAENLSNAMESFPSRTLELVGALEPLRRAWVEQRISNLGVRLVYGATTVALIFALGFAVGGAMWVMVRLARR